MHYLFGFLKIFQVPATREEWKRIQEAFKAKWILKRLGFLHIPSYTAKQ
jgi:hypothetical protein